MNSFPSLPSRLRNSMFCLSILSILVVSVWGSDVIVLPDGTTLQGIRNGSVVSYRGIPFAEAPIGNLRWAPPVPWKNPDVNVVLDATQFRSTCTQMIWGERDEDTPIMAGSEDCLYLNVFVDTAAETSSVPVGVFVHGGSYISGTGAIPLYDGADLVSFWQGRGIIVTTNYRLNVFGFLGSEELRDQDVESRSTGNYGIQDQRLALQWVQQNIGAFGGDSKNVMLFGESAGAASVANHLTMPKSWPYFTSAALESGHFAQCSTQNMSLAESTYDAVKKALRCDDLACMMSKSTEEIFKASLAIPDLPLSSGYDQFSPVADGVEINTHPWIAAANGDIADVPILHGSNADEGSAFTVLRKAANKHQVERFWSMIGFTDDEIEELGDLYFHQTYPEEPRRDTRYWWSGQRSFGDLIMSCPALYLSRTLSNLQTEGQRVSYTYMYHFEHAPRDADYVRHGSELQFVFHQHELMFNENDKTMADLMSSLWGNFLIAHDPNTAAIQEVPPWSPYTTADDNTMIFRDGADAFMMTGLKDAECEFHVNRLDAKIRADFSSM